MPAASDARGFGAFHRALLYLWGVFADLGIALYTIVLGTLAILIVLIARRSRPVDTLARVWGKLIVWTCGITVDIEGLHHFQPGRSYVIVSNHLSNFDIFVTLASVPATIRFVAKKELLRVPVFGQALRLSDHIVIDRQDPENAVRIINAAVARASRGVCILFYAEGTRSPDGKVQPFKKGGVTLALRAQLPVLPMSISGTRKFLPKRRAVIRPGGRVRIVLAAPVETTGLSLEARDGLNERIRQIVISNYVEDY